MERGDYTRMVNHHTLFFAIAIGMAVERNVLLSIGLDGKNRVQRDGYFTAMSLASDVSRRCARTYYERKMVEAAP